MLVYLNENLRMEKRSRLSRFEYLDGYRGFLVVVVILQHLQHANRMRGEYMIFQRTGTYIGVVGFFVLSAFLLTYRLFHLYVTIPSGASLPVRCFHIVRLTVRFFIGRFFRVYMPYLVYVSLVKGVSERIFGAYYSEGRINFRRPWIEYVKLNVYDFTHLWTMPVELRFYLAYPVLPLLFALIPHRLWIVTWTAIMWMGTYMRKSEFFYHEMYNYPYYLTFYYEFFVGAMLGILFYQFEDALHNFKTMLGATLSTALQLFNLVCGTVSFFLIYKGYKHFSAFFNVNMKDFDTNNSFDSTLYWTLFIVTMLVGDRNYFTTWFATNSVITTCGTYSFGMYLYHPMCISFIRSLKPTSDFENILETLAASWLVGCVSYHLLEMRLMDLSSICIKGFEKTLKLLQRDRPQTSQFNV